MKSKLQSFLGYFIAALMVPVVFISLMGMQPIAEGLVRLTGVVISPWYTGGEVVRTVSHGAYELRIHRPVFDWLIGEQREGFVQVVWTPKDQLPETITEDVDFDNDGQADFQVTLHPKTKTAEWRPYSDRAFGMDGPYIIGNDPASAAEGNNAAKGSVGLGVRIKLKNR